MNTPILYNSKYIQKALTHVGLGLNLKEKNNFKGAKQLFEKRIEKIKWSIIIETQIIQIRNNYLNIIVYLKRSYHYEE